jgi:hypothetical protein
MQKYNSFYETLDLGHLKTRPSASMLGVQMPLLKVNLNVWWRLI